MPTPGHGGYYLTADDAEGLIVRPHASVDDAIPNHTTASLRKISCGSRCLAVTTAGASAADALFAALLPARPLRTSSATCRC